VNRQHFTCHVESLIQTQAVWRAHVDPHLITFKLGRNHAGQGLKTEGLKRVLMKQIHKATETAGAISTHFGLATVSIVIPHFEIAAARRWLHEQESIRADSAMPITKAFNFRSAQGYREIAIIEHDKIIARAVHLPKM
jgi:hypothetical protein